MAQYAQPVRDALYLDKTCKNTGAGVIAFGTAVQIDTGTYAVTTAADPLPVKVPAQSDDIDTFWGIAQETIAVGGYGKICRFGSCIAIAGTSGVTANGQIVMDTAASHLGYVTTLADAVTHTAHGIGLAEHTAADGEYVKVFINQMMVTEA